MLDLAKLRAASQKHITAMNGKTPSDFRLEEVEYLPNTNHSVVVSFLAENKNKPISMPKGILNLGEANIKPYERIYKQLLLDKDGNLLKLLIYNAK